MHCWAPKASKCITPAWAVAAVLPHPIVPWVPACSIATKFTGKELQTPAISISTCTTKAISSFPKALLQSSRANDECHKTSLLKTIVWRHESLPDYCCIQHLNHYLQHVLQQSFIGTGTAHRFNFPSLAGWC